MEQQNGTNKKVNKKPRFTLAWKLITIIISLLIIYTVYHVFFGLSESVSTTPAGFVTQNNSIMLEGIIFRNEEPISTQYQGDMRPYYANGERVSVDSVVAAVYSKNSSENINAEIEKIKEKIDILERSNVKGLISVVDIEKLNSEIDSLYTLRRIAILNNENYKVNSIDRELAVCLNKMRIYRGEVKNYNGEIESLKVELEALYDSFDGDFEYIFSDKGGYFYHSCDGYEGVLTYEKLASLNSNTLNELLEQVKKNPIVNNNYTCKFVYENVWKLASSCDESIAALLEVGREYSITLFDIRERELKVTLENIGEIQNGKCILTFSCSNMPEGFDYSRYQSFRLDISSTDGYRVPIEALVTLTDEVTGEKKNGVYVLNASVVYFRRVDIIAESNGYYIVEKLDKDKENYYEYLNINDLIILDPHGMYDGKILKK